MLIMTIALAVATASIAAPGNGWIRVDNPFAQGLEGWIHCNMPDHGAKTCEGMEVYHKAEDGSVITTARVPISNDPRVAFHISVKMATSEGRACTKPKAADIANVTLWAGDTKMQGKKAKELLALLRPALADFALDREMCEYHFQRGGNYRTINTIDGEQQEDLSTDYQWLPADTDYVLYTDEPVEGL